jgi:hypothetical protein
MVYNPRKKVTKILGQINKVAQKGKDNTLEYHRLIDEIVGKGDYYHLEICLADHYNLDPRKYRSIDELKTKTWKHILFETDASFITGLKKLYKANSIYQQGHEIRSDKGDYTLLNVTGELEHYPFKEEKAIVAERWDNVEKYGYTQVATHSQISITKDNSTGTQSNGIQINILDTMIYQIDISKVIWATYSIASTQSNNHIIYSPYEVNRVSTIQAVGTQSYLDPNITYKTNIPTTHGGDYLVTVLRRGTPGWLSTELTFEKYSYKVYIRKDNLLGTIKEFDYYEPNSNYLHLNRKFAISTGLKKTFVEVMKTGATEPITIIYDNLGMSEDRNLLERYRIAINYLNS